MYDHDNKRPRGFGFITFSGEEAVEAVFSGGTMQTLHDKPIEIKRAVPRDQMGAQSRGLISVAEEATLASGARAISSARPVGLNNPAAASFPSAGLANRAFGGLDFSGAQWQRGRPRLPQGQRGPHQSDDSALLGSRQCEPGKPGPEPLSGTGSTFLGSRRQLSRQHQLQHGPVQPVSGAAPGPASGQQPP